MNHGAISTVPATKVSGGTSSPKSGIPLTEADGMHEPSLVRTHDGVCTCDRVGARGVDEAHADVWRHRQAAHFAVASQAERALHVEQRVVPAFERTGAVVALASPRPQASPVERRVLAILPGCAVVSRRALRARCPHRSGLTLGAHLARRSDGPPVRRAVPPAPCSPSPAAQPPRNLFAWRRGYRWPGQPAPVNGWVIAHPVAHGIALFLPRLCAEHHACCVTHDT